MLLLDTHVFLWSLLDPGRLTGRVAAALEEPANELWLSPLTTWEVLVLAERGRVILEPDPVGWFRAVYRTIPFQEAPLTHEVAMESGSSPCPTGTPWTGSSRPPPGSTA